MATPEAYRLLDSYAAWDQHGAMPIDGGYLEQSRVSARWTKVISVEQARIEEERRPKRVKS